MRINNAPYYRKGIELLPLLHDVAAERITNHHRISQLGHNEAIGGRHKMICTKEIWCRSPHQKDFEIREII